MNKNIHVITPEEWAAHQWNGLWYPHCVAITVRGTRCKNPIFYGQVYQYTFDEEPYLSAEDYAILQTGRCQAHR